MVIEGFNNLVSTGAILTAVDFNILADTLSGPFALLVSSAHNNSKTSSPVQRGSGGQSIGLGLSEPLLGLIGGIEWLKQLEKLFSMFAFSLSEVAVSPERLSVGIGTLAFIQVFNCFPEVF